MRATDLSVKRTVLPALTNRTFKEALDHLPSRVTLWMRTYVFNSDSVLSCREGVTDDGVIKDLKAGCFSVTCVDLVSVRKVVAEGRSVRTVGKKFVKHMIVHFCIIIIEKRNKCFEVSFHLCAHYFLDFDALS